MTIKNNNLLIIAGPTSVGKSDISVSLAKELNGEIISTYSMQIYKYMDIGSAKITKEEMQEIPHYLIDFLEPKEEFSVSEFKDLAKAKIDDIQSRGKLPILVGGTGLYINSLICNMNFTESSKDEKYREYLYNLAKEKGNQYVHNMLYDIDITDYEYAAANDHYGKYLIRPDYINAGVLLFNLTKCRETGLFEKSRNQIKTKKWLFADQDALWHSTTKKKIISQKFNDQKFLWPKWTVVRHFSKRLFWLPYPHTANIKQYHVTKVHTVFKYDQFDDILYEYIYLKRKFEEKQ